MSICTASSPSKDFDLSTCSLFKILTPVVKFPSPNRVERQPLHHPIAGKVEKHTPQKRFFKYDIIWKYFN